ESVCVARLGVVRIASELPCRPLLLCFGSRLGLVLQSALSRLCSSSLRIRGGVREMLRGEVREGAVEEVGMGASFDLGNEAIDFAPQRGDLNALLLRDLPQRPLEPLLGR